LYLRLILNYALAMADAHEPLRLPPRARVTPQRRAVIDTLDGWEGSFTVVDLYDRARQAYPALALATTYRTVDLLRRAGSVRPLPGTGRPTYVRCHSGHHHHLICLSCGRVEETEICAAPAPAELERRYGFRESSHEVDIYGTCAQCS
jgi:Fur family ferric uptake transcriptional regulator